jgi:putative aminopeptidase FrvX
MNFELLKLVSNTPGIPGFEDAIQDVVAEALGKSCDSVKRDRMGNVIALKKAARTPAGAKRPLRVVLAAHADEVGAMVEHINPEGYIRFQQVGRLAAAAIASQPVIVHGRKQVLGAIAPHRDKVLEVEDLMIDVGLPYQEVCKLVEVGDAITFPHELVQINDKVVMGRNFDDRIGTYTLLETMSRVGETNVDVYAVSSVQEELGVRGMWTAAYAIEPDIGIAIDGSPCRGPYSEPNKTTEMGRGTGIYLMDRLTIGDRRLVAFLLNLCQTHSIPHQRNIGGGTDASAIQRSRSGALATTVGAPVRYMHSTVQLCHDDDLEATIRLLTTFLEHAHELLRADE